MSHNTHVTATDIPASSESQHPPLSRPYDFRDSGTSFCTRTRSPSSEQYPAILIPVCPLVSRICLSPAMFRYCSVIVSCPRLLSCQFVQEYSSCLLLCLIVFLFC